MLINNLLTYAAAADDSEIAIAVYSIETGEEIALSFAVAADFDEYGDLILSIQIETS